MSFGTFRLDSASMGDSSLISIKAKDANKKLSDEQIEQQAAVLLCLTHMMIHSEVHSRYLELEQEINAILANKSSNEEIDSFYEKIKKLAEKNKMF